MQAKGFTQRWGSSLLALQLFLYICSSQSNLYAAGAQTEVQTWTTRKAIVADSVLKIPRIVAPVEDSLIRLFCPEMNTEKFSQIMELYWVDLKYTVPKDFLPWPLQLKEWIR